MSSRQERIQHILEQALRPVHFELVNESHMHSVPKNSETHFKVLVVSEDFVGKSRIDRQRLVNDLLKAELQAGLHALTQKTLTPEEWAKLSGVPFESPACMGGSTHDKK